MGLLVTQEKKDLNNMIYLSSISELNYIKANKKYIEVGSQTSLSDFELFIEKFKKGLPVLEASQKTFSTTPSAWDLITVPTGIPISTPE